MARNASSRGLSKGSGPQFLGLMEKGGDWLAANTSLVNALNVFPIPDGDTGTNMVLTLRSTFQAAHEQDSTEVGLLAHAMARGALMGARGNSGVILSQIIAGLAEGLAGESTLTAHNLTRALERASVSAYRAMSAPVEGTILTVVREAAEGARRAFDSGSAATVTEVLQAAVTAAQEAVERTPDLLPVLREAGVVDAGGKGLAIFLEGALSAAKGEGLPEPYPLPAGVSNTWLQDQQAETYGFCTEFLLHGPALDIEEIRADLSRWGESDSLVGDAELLRVHIHTNDPDAVLSYAQGKGELDQVSVRDMEQQHKQFVAYQHGEETALRTGIVAVAMGAGLAEVMRSLGASAIVWGGQTMNPSTEDILNAVEATPSSHVIVLPNNKNIVPAAQQARSVTGKTIHVLPTVSVPQGIAALMCFNSDAEADTNLAAMAQALPRVRWGEVTRSIRTTQVRGVAVQAGEAIGLANGELVCSGLTCEDVLVDLAGRLGALGDGLLTIYYGDGLVEGTAQQAAERLLERFPESEVEVVHGGQPHYPYILSIE